MNIVLLILGVFFIILSIILIILNSNNIDESKFKAEVKIREESKALELLAKEDIKIKDEYISSFETNLKNNYHEKHEKRVKVIENEDVMTIQIKEEELKDPNKEEQEIPEIKDSQESVTDKIIKMHKEGLKPNEIAKKLEKGIREIEIILKVNNIN